MMRNPVIIVALALLCAVVTQSCAYISSDDVKFRNDPDEDGSDEPDDCDSSDDEVFPGAPELCDGKDNDCDGVVDNELTWYRDVDGDGYGDSSVYVRVCAQPDGYVAEGIDCDDSDPLISPDASETCDEEDDDCDGLIDEGVELAFYLDSDGDGFGDAAVSAEGCTASDGYVDDMTDCDDDTSLTYPGAFEWCDEVDNDCDGEIDDIDQESPPGDATLLYLDADGDGFGAYDEDAEEYVPVWSCTAIAGRAESAEDCDDADSSTYPDAPESCDDADNDCDGAVDEGADDATVWYRDGDGDGYSGAVETVTSCDDPDGDDATVDLWMTSADDCDDDAPTINPGEAESCNGDDDDCDGEIDEAEASDASTWYRDGDDDGHGDGDEAMRACDQPAGYVTSGDDCDDADPDSYPGAEEVPHDGVDEDCEGGDDYDVDLDGYDVLTEGDCDDGDAAVSPGAEEVCNNGIDDDCSGDGATDSTSWGWCEPLGDISLGEAFTTLEGVSAGDNAGTSLAGVGDVDGDGIYDIAVGSPFIGSSDGGGVYVVYGSRSGTWPLDDVADAYIQSSTSSMWAGRTVATAGDLNDDGYADILIGADGYSSSKGTSLLFWGPLSGTVSTSAADLSFQGRDGSDRSGGAIGAGGDLDGDGALDFVTGASRANPTTTNQGEAYVVFGPVATSSSSLGSSADAIISGGGGDYLGDTVVIVGDTSGDGLDDLVVGAKGVDVSASDAGAAYLIEGPPASGSGASAASSARYGGSASVYLGTSLAGAGDINDDGYDDVIVGSPNEDVAYLVEGPWSGSAALTSSSADAALIGDGSTEFGGAVAGGQDINQDGSPDVIIGARDAEGSATDSGAAYLFYGDELSGTRDSSSADASFLGLAASDYAGYSVTMTPDFTGDLVPDLLIGAIGADPSGSASGAAYVLAGGGD